MKRGKTQLLDVASEFAGKLGGARELRWLGLAEQRSIEASIVSTSLTHHARVRGRCLGQHPIRKRLSEVQRLSLARRNAQASRRPASVYWFLSAIA